MPAQHLSLPQALGLALLWSTEPTSSAIIIHFITLEGLPDDLVLADLKTTFASSRVLNRQ
jgi:hypothetical protein